MNLAFRRCGVLVACVGAILLIQDDDPKMNKSDENRTPAVDEFDGYYNVPVEWIIDERPITDDHRRQVLITVDRRITPKTIFELEGITQRLLAVAVTFEPPLKKSHPTQWDKPLAIWFRDDRTAVVQFTDYDQITLENCERIRLAFAQDFPLWRVAVAMADESDMVIIYPTAVVIPRKWQSRAEEYWRTIGEIQETAAEMTSDMIDHRQMLWVEHLMNEKLKQNAFPDEFEPFVIALFSSPSYRKSDIESGTSTNVWFVADKRGAEDVTNSYFPKPKEIPVGYFGSGSDLGLTPTGQLQRAPFKLARNGSLVARSYNISYDAVHFKRDQIMIWDP